MNFFYISLSRLLTLATVLAASIFLIATHATTQTAWSTLFSDISKDRTVQIRRIKIVREFPLTDYSLNATLARSASLETVEQTIPNLWTDPTPPSESLIPQLKTTLGSEYPYDRLRNLEGITFAFFADIDASEINHLVNPKVFFYRIHGAWKLYANDSFLGSGTTEDRYTAFTLPQPLPSKIRLTWIVKNRFPKELIYLDPLYGLSIRSEFDTRRARIYLPMQHEFPHIVASVVFLCLAAVTLLLAASSPRYSDLWAFATFCASLFLAIWIKTPYYWESYDFGSTGRSDNFAAVRAIVHAFVVFAAVALSLSFFRARGYFLYLILGLSTAMLIHLVYQAWPYGWDLPPYKQYAILDTNLVYVLWSTQVIAFAYGIYSLIDQMRTFHTQGLIALLKPMWRRIGEATTYSVAMGLMLWTYADAFSKQSTTTGPDLFLLYGLVPAMAMLMQFYWMMTASQRFREKMTPRLDYVDYLVHNIGQRAYEWSYTGVLARFDLKGFKSLTRIKAKSGAHTKAVNAFIMRMRAEIEPVVAGGRTVFRFKTNGDENIWTIFAKDEASARTTLTEIVTAWHARSRSLLDSWKKALRADVGAAFDAEDEAVLAHLDLHAMFCILKDMRIDPVGDAKHPDYICDSFTLLSEAFKTSLHDRVAMYRNEAESLIAAGLTDARFLAAEDGDPRAGFLSWQGTSSEDLPAAS